MKANELRIGNLVNVGCSRFGITANIKAYPIKAKDLLAIETCQMQKLKVELTPIPITEEWLLKLGYQKVKNHYYNSGHCIWDCDGLLACDKNGIILRSVHQLQNLYFALTGEELTIK